VCSAADGRRSHRSTADSVDDHWGNVWAAAPRLPTFAAIAVVTGTVLAIHLHGIDRHGEVLTTATVSDRKAGS
jgi:hypothetical protein